MKDYALQRFLDYVKIDTQSDDSFDCVPSTAKQLNLSRKLQEDLKALGIDSELNEFGIVYAALEGEKGLDPIGLNAHVDTAAECSGANVKPLVHENYDGGTLVLGNGYSMSPKEFPTLGKHIGKTIVTTSGDTLLGADDKAGLAIIMGVLEYFVTNKDVKHHPIQVCFTPDEEIGRGPDHFDPKKFGAKFAYTIDGGDIEELASETFNAAHARVICHGISIHPGEAKGKMVNALNLAMEFDSLLPALVRPQYTEGFEGFNHMISLEGNCDIATCRYIIRNHDRTKLESQKEMFFAAKSVLEARYPGCTIELEIGDDYRNMKEVIDTCPECVEKVNKAYEELGIPYSWKPIRGGTDGAGFSFMGVPTPNLPTGSYNHHGRFEYLVKEDFDKIIEILIALLKA